MGRSSKQPLPDQHLIQPEVKSVQMIQRVQVGRANRGFRRRLALTMALLVCLSEPSVALTNPAGTTRQSRQPTLPSVPAGKETDGAIDGGTLLLEYLLGEEKSLLWAVTGDSVNIYELPERAVIERAAHRLSELLTARLPRENESN